MNTTEKQREIWAETLTQGCIDPTTYEFNDSFREGENTFHGVHTVTEIVRLLESDKNVEFDGLFLAVDKDGRRGAVRLNKEKFLESWKGNGRKRNTKKLYESFNGGYEGGMGAGNLVGNDYTPLLGGPFHKQLYLHDMLRGFALAFHASNHDPIARALLNITVDFTLGRGYRVDSKNEKAVATWRAFEKANALPEKIRHIAHGLARDGEVMVWWLPNNQSQMQWQLNPGQELPEVMLPRISLIDPSTCWEVITYPESIDRVIAYQLVYPTQYNLYQAKDGGSIVPSSKFIMQQVPAEEVDHFRINRAPNEKRGRSDLYSIFGYLKRLRDTVEYSIVSMAKAAAWAIDTTIEGSPADVQAYLQDQQSKKSIAPAGSEFIHSPKIKREYLSNAAVSSSGGSVSAFEWCLNMICASVQIPVSYLGTHLSGGQTKASALVGTEPVTKKFEARQLVYEEVLRKMWDRVMKSAGLEGAECEITFPELISQDRSAKIKDLILAQEVDAVSHEYMSTSIAQELGNTSYDYEETQAAIKKEKAAKMTDDADSVLISPLTSKAKVSSGGDSESSPVSKDERAKTAKNDRSL
jgi:hypothetical protein